MRAPDRRPRMPRRGPVGAALVSVLVLVVVLAASLVTAHAGRPTPQIHGSVAAPTAADISPICDAPDPTGILGPSSTLPSNPTSTLVTPPGGVVNFTATRQRPLRRHREPADHLHPVGHRGQLVHPSVRRSSTVTATRSPSRSSTRRGTSTSPATTDQVLDKFSPTGQLLWSVDPGGRQPDRALLGGHGLGLRAGGQRRADTSRAAI